MRLTSLYSSTVAFLCPRSIKIQTAGNRFYHLHHSSRISGPKVNANTQNLVRIHYNNQYEYLIPSFRYYQARTMTSRHVTKGEEAEKMVKRSEDTSDSASTSSDEFKELGTESTSPKQEELQSKELGAAEKLKLAIRDYGGTVIVFHVTISLMSLGSCYVLVSSGLDVVGILEWIGVSEAYLQSKVTQGGSTFVISYAIHKIFAPVRLGITLTCVPFIVKKLRAIGFLKTPV